MPPSWFLLHWAQLKTLFVIYVLLRFLLMFFVLYVFILVDIWSVGCIMAEMIIGKTLFKGKDCILSSALCRHWARHFLKPGWCAAMTQLFGVEKWKCTVWSSFNDALLNRCNNKGDWLDETVWLDYKHCKTGAEWKAITVYRMQQSNTFPRAASNTATSALYYITIILLSLQFLNLRFMSFFFAPDALCWFTAPTSK